MWISTAPPTSAARWPQRRVVLAAGLYGSGSTWAYNVVRRLLDDAPGAFADQDVDLPDTAAEAPVLVVKSHLPDASMRAFVRQRGVPVVLTVRDPRDALASMRQRFAVPHLDLRQALVVSADRLCALVEACAPLVLRYEDGFTRTSGTVRRIADFLGVTVSAPRVDAIHDGLLPSRVAADIATLSAEGAFGEDPGPLAADPLTQWHAGHVGDGRVGKFPQVLSPAEAEALLADTAGFCARFGYCQG